MIALTGVPAVLRRLVEEGLLPLDARSRPSKQPFPTLFVWCASLRSG